MEALPYRQAPLKASDPYLVAWNELHRRRVRIGLALLALMPGLPLFGYVCALLAKVWPHALVVAPMVVAAMLFSFPACVAYCSGFMCPHCRQTYANLFSLHPWPSRCKNCRIPMGTPQHLAELEAARPLVR